MSVTPATRVAMVRPPRGMVNRGIVPLRVRPDDGAELVDEAHFGEELTRLGEDGGWSYVQGSDLYFGWIPTARVPNIADPPDQWVVAVPFARARVAASDDADGYDELPAGTPLIWKQPHGEWWQIAPEGWLRVDETIAVAEIPHRYPTADDLLATAESFLGVPYLWGGTSAHGIDCSGLTQQVYRLNGVGLDRDADQQALGGRPVDQARPGDLFFFGAERVTHTAIATGLRTFIHAPASGQTVQRGELTDPVDMARLRAIRRYLP